MANPKGVVENLTDYLQSMLKFMPVSVLQHLTNVDPENRTLPQCQHFKTAVMVAEIKNFYDQANRHKNFQSDQDYNEYLAVLSNRFLEIMSKTIHKYGGDIVQFIGNSLIAIWPRSDPLGESSFEGKEDDDTDANIARKATQCALDIKNESQKIISAKTEIFMGIGFGHCGILHVGGVFKRVEYFCIGDGLSQALRALRLTTSEQSVIISWPMWNIVDKYFVCEALGSSYDNEKSVKYLFGLGIRSKSNTLVLRTEIEEQKLREIQMELKTYIPAAFRPYLKLKRDTYGNEHRRITMMVMNIEIDDFYQNQSFLIIQKLIERIQQQIYKLEGSFNKIISYDGGFTVICNWGISPISHTDDATRAVLAALNILKSINHFAQSLGAGDYSPPIHIGICTGNVFMGIVGNEGSRKEIVTLGEPIERAFLFMQAASKHYGKIYVDYDTKTEASPFIDFKYIEHVEFAHKITNQALFEPIDPHDDWYDTKYSAKQVDVMKVIRLHSNPFQIDYRNDYQHKFSQIYGQNDVISQILDDLSIYCASPEDNVWVLGIKGAAGAGKSLFARNLIQQVISKEKDIMKRRNEILLDTVDSEYNGEGEGLQFKLIVSTCNAEIEKRFIGIWIPILREMLIVYSKALNKKKEILLNNLIKNSDVEDKISLVEEIFGVKGLSRNVMQTIIFQDQYNYLRVEGYPTNVEEDLLFFLHEFIYEVVSKLKNDILFFIIMDNVSMMDRASWRLFELITSENDHLIIVMCIQSKAYTASKSFSQAQSLQFKISDHAFQFYQERLLEIEREIFNVVEMEPITEYDLRQILIDLAEQYEKDMRDEIILMTEMIDSNNSVKTYHGQLEIKNRLIKKYQVYDYFKEVEKEVVTEVVKKCQGNPLLCISLVFQLLTVIAFEQKLQTDFINIREQLLLSTNKLRYFFKTNCWNNIELPPISLKQNCCLIEDAFKAKGSRRKLPSEMSVQDLYLENFSSSAYQLLKTASINGERFNLKQLQEIFIFDDYNNYHIELLLKVLENRDLIELVYEDGQGDYIYRFCHVFLRETLFQLQIYDGQRQQIHSKISAYLQENMINNWLTDWNFEKEQVMLIQNLMAEEKVQNE